MTNRLLAQVAGAVSTGSHGSSQNHGTLSDFIDEIEIVLGDGSLCKLGDPDDRREADLWYDRAHSIQPAFCGDDLLRAVRCSVGHLGIITSISLKCQPLKFVTREVHRLPLAVFIGSARAMLDSSTHMMVRYAIGHDDVAVVTLTEAPLESSDASSSAEYDGQNWFAGTPAFDAPGEKMVEQSGEGVWNSLQRSYSIQELRGVFDCLVAAALDPILNGRVVEFKFLLPSAASMLGSNSVIQSPTSEVSAAPGHDVVLCLNVFWYGPSDLVAEALQALETSLSLVSASFRPHWGKTHFNRLSQDLDSSIRTSRASTFLSALQDNQYGFPIADIEKFQVASKTSDPLGLFFA